ncbi:MAG TPA: hypothetical protein VGQ39_13510 [Pyrinomonadaceae bacterium]|jgi:hypothetical protein|nr:hypothetical protein [Pyrinomonadaceae bacterium]
MRSRQVERFAKDGCCPPSNQLLSIHLAAVPRESAVEIISLLDVCEFCNAEAHFSFRISNVNVTAQIPGTGHYDFGLLAEVLPAKCSNVTFV